MTTQDRLAQLRDQIRNHYLIDEATVLDRLISQCAPDEALRERISAKGAELVRRVREDSSPSLMERFLGEYGLSTKEGVALMCLAEALLRVPDAETIDDLIEDKIASGQWREHLGHSNSSLINSATWALLMTGQLLSDSSKQGWLDTLHTMVKRLGEPVIRKAVAQAMKELGRQFVLGRTITEALKRGQDRAKQGYTFSYDMLGEAARTERDAQRYFKAYSDAIAELAPKAISTSIRDNPGISVKLSALHPRYEFLQRERVMTELVPRLLALAVQAKEAGMGLNIDAEEADRLDLSLDVIEAVIAQPELSGWDGLGVVVQAYSRRALPVIEWLYTLAELHDRKLMVRLVKGAYWDAEIKRAQTLGLSSFPVYTRKTNTDVSYICCARRLLQLNDRIYPQFATHNAHTLAAVLEMANEHNCYEFQRLHGMGESLHHSVVSEGVANCRIYAPVGAHKDLLAYLVRRLLENGANSSFVNQLVDPRYSPETIAKDPFADFQTLKPAVSSQRILPAERLYDPARSNSKGWDFTDPKSLAELLPQMRPFATALWTAKPLLAVQPAGAKVSERPKPCFNPALPEQQVGWVTEADATDVALAIESAVTGYVSWNQQPVNERAAIIRNVGRLFEQHAPELFVLATREAGKTLADAVAEVREAIDFAYYYANQTQALSDASDGCGVFLAISPWNFPLAIFSGQVLAALAAGNSVLAKPAEQTPLIAARAVELMYDAGISRSALQLLPGQGETVGAALTADPRISGVCFTGSTQTAWAINRSMSKYLPVDSPLIAETGGLNAMIVDSTALPEQVVRDVVASAFQSAGQRCSALRILYLQDDIADQVIEMLKGAMQELKLGDPALLNTDIGPVIDRESQVKIQTYIAQAQQRGDLLYQLTAPKSGLFVAPALIRVTGIEVLEEEVFGPVLHIARFKASALDQVVDSINDKGYGLTFGLHTRVDRRVEQICSRIKVGNIYVNRNQIGAIVGSQPFGGEGLSGTGPKAGGPGYLSRFLKSNSVQNTAHPTAVEVALEDLQDAILNLGQRVETSAGPVGLPEVLPGPTGEVNRLTHHPRGLILCLGPDRERLQLQVAVALRAGNRVLAVSSDVDALPDEVASNPAVRCLVGVVKPELLVQLEGLAGVAACFDELTQRAYRRALAEREGAILPLISELDQPQRFQLERHLCIDTTAAGGNASLIASSE